jgi:cytidylate kinase
MNIATAGLTAAGKTTHGKLLAAALGFKHVSATELFLHFANITDESPTGLWYRKFDAIEKLREGDALDDLVEAELVRLARSEENTVFDTWALPWLTDAPMLRIWFESDFESRTRKSFVSQHDFFAPGTFQSIQWCKAHVREKDETTKARFQRRHNFDLFTDHESFDLVVTNSDLMPDTELETSRQGIRTLAPVLLHAVRWSLYQKTEDQLALKILDPHKELVSGQVLNAARK